MVNHPYHLKYYLKIEYGTFTKTELNDEDRDDVGGTDALIIISNIFHKGHSIHVLAMDGRTEQSMSDRDVFKSWIWIGSEVSRWIFCE